MQAVKVVIEGGVDGPTWEHQPVLELHVLDTTGFVLYTLVKVGGGGWLGVAVGLAGVHPCAAQCCAVQCCWEDVPCCAATARTMPLALLAVLRGMRHAPHFTRWRHALRLSRCWTVLCCAVLLAGTVPRQGAVLPHRQD